MLSSVTENQLRRVCRMYRTNIDAAKALGISQQHLYKLCKKYGVARPVIGKRPTNSIHDRT
jgi:transcriptional regulator with PAS, ATPase and Fis domain